MRAAALLPIAGLRAGVVPHHEWASRRWLYANPLWYYHRERSPREGSSGLRSYELVDPELREVCRLLNDAGLRTTPSCQGHSYGRERFERIWAELTRESHAIRGRGLVVRDCETDQPYLFRCEDWALPWSCFSELHQEVAAHQSQGYLGVIVPPSWSALEEKFRRSPYETKWSRLAPEENVAADVLGGTVFAVRVDALEESVRAAEWRGFTAYVADALRDRSRDPLLFSARQT